MAGMVSYSFCLLYLVGSRCIPKSVKYRAVHSLESENCLKAIQP